MSWRDNPAVAAWAENPTPQHVWNAARAARDRELRQAIQQWHDSTYPDAEGEAARAAFRRVLALLDHTEDA